MYLNHVSNILHPSNTFSMFFDGPGTCSPRPFVLCDRMRQGRLIGLDTWPASSVCFRCEFDVNSTATAPPPAKPMSPHKCLTVVASLNVTNTGLGGLMINERNYEIQYFNVFYLSGIFLPSRQCTSPATLCRYRIKRGKKHH